MNKTKRKTDVFLKLLGSASKGALACLIALLILNIIDNVSSKKKTSKKDKLYKAAANSQSSIEEKIEK